MDWLGKLEKDNAEPLTLLKQYFLQLQEDICLNLKALGEEKDFQEEEWNYSQPPPHPTLSPPQGERARVRGANGGGKTRILEEGSLFERLGVNFSCIQGEALPQTALPSRKELAGQSFVAMGVSVVAHPLNPYVPTSHFNVRYIATYNQNKCTARWFGGGFDLTPYYPFEEDCIHWHTMAKEACLPFGAEVYPKYKAWCDQYFYLKHRNETRGIGGLFFDDVQHWSFEKSFDFIKSVASHYLKAYLPIVQKRKNLMFTEREREFQLYRRGRYLEFNLVYDRGTLFGLQSGGRTESILMSLPPKVNFKYNWHPTPNSKEALLYTDYLKPKEWV